LEISPDLKEALIGSEDTYRLKEKKTKKPGKQGNKKKIGYIFREFQSYVIVERDLSRLEATKKGINRKDQGIARNYTP